VQSNGGRIHQTGKGPAGGVGSITKGIAQEETEPLRAIAADACYANSDTAFRGIWIVLQLARLVGEQKSSFDCGNLQTHFPAELDPALEGFAGRINGEYWGYKGNSYII